MKRLLWLIFFMLGMLLWAAVYDDCQRESDLARHHCRAVAHDEDLFVCDGGELVRF